MAKQGMAAAAGVFGVITPMLGVASTVLMSQSYMPLPHPSCSTTPAMACGVTATVLALTTQILASTATGFCGAWEFPSERNRVARLLSTTSWFLTIKAVILFMLGTMIALGPVAGKYRISVGHYCVAVGVGAFGAATILFLTVFGLQITLYYTCCISLQTTAAAEPTKPSNANKSPNTAADRPPPVPKSRRLPSS